MDRNVSTWFSSSFFPQVHLQRSERFCSHKRSRTLAQWNNIFMDYLPWNAAKLSLRSQSAAQESRAVGDSLGVLQNQNWEWIKHKLISHVCRVKQTFKPRIKYWNIFKYSSSIWATSTLGSSKTFLCSVSQHPNLPGLSIIQTIMKTCWPGEHSGYNHKFLLQ